MRLLIIFILFQVPLISYATEMQTGRASGMELPLLPELCQARFKNGLAGKEFSKWKGILGMDYLNVHHYCDGLTFLNRASRFDKHRKFYLNSANSNFLYNIKHLKNPDYVLLPDIYYQLAVVQKNMRVIEKAIEYANKSIQSKKKYLKPYTFLADIYFDLGNKEQAEKILLEAKKYHPRSRAIERRLKKVK